MLPSSPVHETPLSQQPTPLRVLRLPPVLVLHLKRFNKNVLSRAKLNTVVDFPIDVLDLSEYMAPESPDIANCQYRLYGNALARFPYQWEG